MDRYTLNRQIEEHPDAKLKDLVVQMLYDDIISLKIPPGTRLNVNQLAAALGISRTPVSEAVGSLAEMGFVVNPPDQQGSFVLDLSLPDMISLYQVRDAIESEAAYLCAYNAEDETIRELTRLADAFRDSVIMHDIRGMKDTDMPFHRMIIDFCGNTYLKRSYDQLVPYLNNNPWLASVRYNHTAVVSAIRMRLPEMAKQAMSQHIAESLNFTSLSGDQRDPFSSLK